MSVMWYVCGVWVCVCINVCGVKVYCADVRGRRGEGGCEWHV